jgi:DNA-binding NtrC family response regulator
VQLFFGTGTASASLMQQIQRFAQTPYPILLSGPTGSGKTKIARLIGAHSARRDRPFVTLPLTGVPEELRHTELFGSMRGSFTGATNDRIGAVEAAHGPPVSG